MSSCDVGHMRGPDFIGIGAQRAGTSFLFDLLRHHEGVGIPDEKEVHFFDDPDRFSRGVKWYYGRFDAVRQRSHVCGEITPDYMFIEEARDRLRTTLSSEGLKLLVTVRDPIDRAYSHYRATVSRGREDRPFLEAIEGDLSPSYGSRSERIHRSYVQRGFYHRQLSRFLQVVDQSAIFVVSFRDLTTDADVTLGRICKFLGVDAAAATAPRRAFRNEVTVPRWRWLGPVMESERVRSLLRTCIPQARWRRRLWRLSRIPEAEVPQAAPEAVQLLTEVYREDLDALRADWGIAFDRW